MLGSIWFANLDCLVGNIQYLQDDPSESKQYNISSKSYQSNQPEFGHKYYDDIGYRASSRHECTCTGDCDNYDRNITKLEHDIINLKLNDSIKQHHELYTKLSK